MSYVSLRSTAACLFGVAAQAVALVALAGSVAGTDNGPTVAIVAKATAANRPLSAVAMASTAQVAASATPSTSVAADVPVAPAVSHPFAAPRAVTAATGPTAGGLAQVTFALLLVLVAIFAVAWLARRMRGINNRVGDAIDILADVSLGQKERAVLLKVGQKQILVGVAPGRVNTLHVLDEPIELKKPAAAPDDSRPNFKQLMLRSLGK